MLNPIMMAIGLALAAGSAQAADTPGHFQVQRADDSDIDAYVSPPTSGKAAIVLMLQGSVCESSSPASPQHIPFPVSGRIVRLDIEKYAVTPATADPTDQHCPKPYLEHNTVPGRVLDVLTVAAWLRGHAPWWNHRLYLVGVSEGASVAALAGPLIPETRGIVIINGSIGRPFREGWADAMAAEVARGGGGAQDQVDARKEAAVTWEKAHRNPTPDEIAFGGGNTLKWWDAMIDLRPANSLILTDAPILVEQSDNDEMTPVETERLLADSFRKAGRTNLTYVELKGLDHGLRDKSGAFKGVAVLTEAADWVTAREKAAH